jgi:hypothetical protein
MDSKVYQLFGSICRDSQEEFLSELYEGSAEQLGFWYSLEEKGAFVDAMSDYLQEGLSALKSQTSRTVVRARWESESLAA